ncbi:MAG TPA: CBS domain-containing protein [Acidimicrobiia bacterium]|nr:CBS domain-containing protein [Acidimicrobiia bacterium]
MATTVAHLLAAKGRDIWSVSPDDTVFKALEDMAEKGVGAMVVLDGDGNLAGIMSERDYARKVVLVDRVSRETTVSEIMTPEVHCVSLHSTVEECMSMMTDRRIRHLPVLDEGNVVGVVSIGDIVKAVMRDQRQLIEQLEQYITS